MLRGLLMARQARGIRGASVPTKIRLTYFQEQSFRVELQYKSSDEWTDCFEIGAIKLPNVAYLGFSAETGELTDNHDIIQVSSHNMHMTEAWRNTDTNDKGGRQKGKSYNPNRGRQSGGWVWFFLKLLLIPVVLVGGYVGYAAYRSSKRGSRF
jgi:mannose-binding lectin 2